MILTNTSKSAKMPNDAVQKLKERYNYLHPLVFQRSLERAKNLSDLFDILDSAPKGVNLLWDEKERCWTKTTDLLGEQWQKKDSG